MMKKKDRFRRIKCVSSSSSEGEEDAGVSNNNKCNGNGKRGRVVGGGSGTRGRRVVDVDVEEDDSATSLECQALSPADDDSTSTVDHVDDKNDNEFSEFDSPKNKWPWRKHKLESQESEDEDALGSRRNRVTPIATTKQRVGTERNGSEQYVDDGEVPGTSYRCQTPSKRVLSLVRTSPTTLHTPTKTMRSRTGTSPHNGNSQKSTLTPHLRKARIANDDSDKDEMVEHSDSDTSVESGIHLRNRRSARARTVARASSDDDEEKQVNNKIEDYDSDSEDPGLGGNNSPGMEIDQILSSASSDSTIFDEEIHHQCPVENLLDENDGFDDFIGQSIDPEEVLRGQQNTGFPAGLEYEMELVSSTNFAFYTYVEHHQTRRLKIHYAASLIDQLRHMECYFQKETRKFIFPIKMETFNALRTALDMRFPKSIVAQSFAKVVFALSRYRPLNIESRRILSHHLKWIANFRSLTDFQRKSVEFAIKRGGRVILADEAGMGKSAEGIVTALFFEKEFPLLVLCATNLQEFWRTEFQKWLPKAKHYSISMLVDVQSCEAFTKMQTSPDIVILAYPLLRLLRKKHEELEQDIVSKNFRVVIMDDCHRIKHYYTKTSKAVKNIIHRANRRILLTSNPACGVPIELFQQLHAVDRLAFKDYRSFADRYCGTMVMPGPDGEDVVVASTRWRDALNLEELRHLMFGTCVFRNFRSDNFNLPNKSREKVILRFNPEAYFSNARRILGRLQYKSCLKDLASVAAEEDKYDPRYGIFKWFKKSGNAKLPMIFQYLDEFDMDRRKIIVFYRHNCVLEGVEKLLKKRNVDYIMLKGSSTEDRELLCCQFNSDPHVRVALLNLSVTTAGGLDLCSADTVIFTEYLWDPIKIVVNEDRAIGSLFQNINLKKPIEIKFLVAEEPDAPTQIHIDDYLWELMTGKLSVLYKLGLVKDDFIENGISTTYFDPHMDNNYSDMLSDMSSVRSNGDSDYYNSDSDEIDEDDYADATGSEDLSSQGEDDEYQDEYFLENDEQYSQSQENGRSSSADMEVKGGLASEEDDGEEILVGPRVSRHPAPHYNLDMDYDNTPTSSQVKQEDEEDSVSEASVYLLDNDYNRPVGFTNDEKRKSISLGNRDTSSDDEDGENDSAGSLEDFVLPGSQSETDPEGDYLLPGTRKRRQKVKRGTKGAPSKQFKKKSDAVFGSSSSKKSKPSRRHEYSTSSSDSDEASDSVTFKRKVSKASKSFLFK